MIWIAPSEKDTATGTLGKRLWDAADQLRANSGLKAGILRPDPRPVLPALCRGPVHRPKWNREEVKRGGDSEDVNEPKEPNLPARSQFLVYAAEDGRMKVEVRLKNETVWLTQ
jgi:hypothetical protein